MQCSLSPSRLPALHIGCRPLEHYTECTECPNAVPLGKTFRSAGLFAAVPECHRNSSNGKDHMAENTTRRNINSKSSCLMTRSSLRRGTQKALRRDHRQSYWNLAVGHCAGQPSPYDQLLVLHTSRSLTAKGPEVLSAVLQVVQGVHVQQGPLVPVHDPLLYRLVQWYADLREWQEYPVQGVPAHAAVSAWHPVSRRSGPLAVPFPRTSLSAVFFFLCTMR